MKLVNDYILVKECISENTFEDSNLKFSYDDNSTFMEVEIIDVSRDMILEYIKYYQSLSKADATMLVNSYYKIGNHLIIRRVSKTPFKDGLYFISFKDVIAVCNNEGGNNNE